MADLEVDLGLLERTAGSLSMLIEEFDNCSKIANSAQASTGDPALVIADAFVLLFDAIAASLRWQS
jgi:hypothetical protein